MIDIKGRKRRRRKEEEEERGTAYLQVSEEMEFR